MKTAKLVASAAAFVSSAVTLVWQVREMRKARRQQPRADQPVPQPHEAAAPADTHGAHADAIDTHDAIDATDAALDDHVRKPRRRAPRTAEAAAPKVRAATRKKAPAKKASPKAKRNAQRARAVPRNEIIGARSH